MPLIQSGSKKALQKNIETEMKANPDKKSHDQNLAISYSIQRKNRKKMSQGGVASFGDRHPHSTGHYADGGEIVEPINQRIGSEESLNKAEKLSDEEMARDKHSLKHFAQGGEALTGTYESGEEKGINRRYDRDNPISISKAGRDTRSGTKWDRSAKSGEASMPSIDRSLAKEHLGAAKKKHKEVLSEMRSMPKPNLYANGGPVQKPMPDTSQGNTTLNDAIGNPFGPSKPVKKYKGGMLHDEMPEEINPRAGHESALDHDEMLSHEEMKRDRNMKRKMYAEGGFAEPEWEGAGTLGFPMLEQENDPDLYSEDGIINYAHGGMAAPELTEPTSQRLGSEPYLDEMEQPLSYHGRHQGSFEESRSLAQENPSIAESIRRKYMASGGMAVGDDLENMPLDQNAIEHTNYMNKLNRQLGDHEMYSEMDALNDLETPSSDGMDTRDIETDKYDMVNAIRRKVMGNRAQR